MAKNLVIVESPAKAKTIEGYLGKDYQVLSSFGHVRDLPKKNDAIDIENGFLPTYEVSKDKKDVISKLKKASKDSETVFLASDDDREGEAIAWHLKEALKLPEKKTKRIVFREITKGAITKAISEPRGIDVHLVDAQQARRVLDRLVGFELSPILWKKIKTGLSAGRVQSVAVRLVVEREREIEKFEPTESFKLTAQFTLESGETLQAEYSKKFASEGEARSFLEDCVSADFSIADLEKKELTRSPVAPFTTSTLQQAASSRLGMSVAQTMRLAQKLYEAGHITYMRTDAVTLSKEAQEKARAAIISAYGEEYAFTRQFTTKNANAQEAHEAIRPTDFAKEKAGSDAREQKLYNLIWSRAIASQMSDAKVEKTTVRIAVSTREEQLTSSGTVVLFPGYLKVYADAKKEEVLLPPLAVGQSLTLAEMQAKQVFSKHPARYTEATLVKQLEEQGIGRPSTYAPTISTIQNRGYIVKESRDGKERESQVMTLKEGKVSEEKVMEKYGSEKNKLFPTNVAKVVNDFLVEHFPDIVDYGFTAEVEEEFDEIARGKRVWNKMLADFYKEFHKKVEVTGEIDRSEVPSERVLGKDPKTGRVLKVRLGRFGPLAQIGEQEDEEPVKYASLRNDQYIDTISLEEALELFKLPREAGKFEDKEVTVAIGRFGPYVKHDGKFVSLPKEDDPYTVELDRCIELIKAKREADKNKYISEFETAEGEKIEVLNGRYGPYIKKGKNNYKIPKDIEDPKTLTLEDCEKIIAEAPEKKGRWKKK